MRTPDESTSSACGFGRDDAEQTIVRRRGRAGKSAETADLAEADIAHQLHRLLLRVPASTRRLTHSLAGDQLAIAFDLKALLLVPELMLRLMPRALPAAHRRAVLVPAHFEFQHP